MFLIKPKKNRKKGFTLIELIVVVTILAILAAIAIPSFVGLQTTAKNAVIDADAATIASAVNTFNAAYPDGKITAKPTTLADLNTSLGSFALVLADDANATAAFGNVSISGTGVATFTKLSH